MDEWDDDGDGYVECAIDAAFLYNSNGTVNAWENNQTIYGGLDCEDDDANAYPDALRNVTESLTIAPIRNFQQPELTRFGN